MNQKDFELESKNPIYTDLDRLHYRTKVDPYSHWNYIENYHSSYKHAKMWLQDSIHSLIKCRNKVLNAMLVFSETDNPKIFGFTPENIIKFYEATSILEQKEKYDIWNVWHIKKWEAKPKGTKIMKYNEDDVELTDFETMSEIIST